MLFRLVCGNVFGTDWSTNTVVQENSKKHLYIYNINVYYKNHIYLLILFLAGSLKEFGVLIANVEEERERMVKV